MQVQSVCLVGSVLLLAAAGAIADTKIVELNHTDGYILEEESEPASDDESVSWIGEGTYREDMGSVSLVVLEREKRILVIYHVEEQYCEVALPFDIRKQLTPEAADQLVALRSFTMTVTPTGETRKVGDWSATGYRFEAKSQSLELEMTLWATTDVGFDFDAAGNMEYELVSLLFWGDYADAMRKVPGIIVASEGSYSLPIANIGPLSTRSTTKSIEEVDPPAGIYAPPPGYARTDFNYLTLLAHID